MITHSYVCYDVRGLLESVCSDIIEMRDQKLEYFSGTYEEWLEHNAEMRSFHENRQDGQRRRDEHIKKSGAGQDVIKKKLERNAMHRGKRPSMIHTTRRDHYIDSHLTDRCRYRWKEIQEFFSEETV